MIVFWQQRLIYLAVPKTGTTATEMALQPYADIHFKNPPHRKHITAGTMHGFRKLLTPADPAEFEQVAVMREPLSWLGSWFRYRSRSQLDGTANSTAGMDFNRFVEMTLQTDPPPSAQIGSQFQFLCGKTDRPLADRIYPYTEVPRMFAYFERRLGITLKVPHSNRSPQGSLALDAGLLRQLKTRRETEFSLYDQVADRQYCND